MMELFKRMGILLGVGGVILLATAFSANSGDRVVEEIVALYTDKEVEVVPKIDNFIILLDQSGSMYIKDQGKTQTKTEIAKEIMSAVNERVPELGYKGSFTVFSPDRTLVGPTKYERETFRQTIENLPDTGRVYGNRTPLGDAILQLDPLLSKSTGKTAVVIVSDGEKNVGTDAIAAARTIQDKYPSMCFHAVSLADVYADGTELRTDAAAVEQFAQDVFYTVETRKIAERVVEEVVAVEAAAVVPEGIELEPVHFPFDQYSLTPKAKMKLDENLAKLKKESQLNITIQGHTDAIGTEEYNHMLSKRRAQTVYNYLLERGISPERMETVGYGESQPIASNSTPKGRSLNRRSEIEPSQ